MTLRVTFGTQTTAISAGLNSLANGSSASSSAVDNSGASNSDAADVEVRAAAAGSNTGIVNVYLQASGDGGTNYDTAPPQGSRLIGSMQLNGTTLVQKTFRVIDLPEHFILVLVNNSGGALAASGNTVKYQTVDYVDA